MAAPPFITRLTCLRCGAHYGPDQVDYVCPHHPNQGSDLGTLDVEYDYAAVEQALPLSQLATDPDRSMGRYWPLLPVVERASLPPLPVGNTPLIPAHRLGESLGLVRLFVKDDGRNPSASLKDRASAVAVAKARELGHPLIATASTGNAAAALASQCAAAGLPSVIFVPASAPAAKVAQLLIHGSLVLSVSGTYDQAYDLCQQACEEFGWYNRNTGYNPYMTEGKKTVTYEIVEQMAGPGPLQPPVTTPDALFVSVGDGCILGGIHKGFVDLLALGWIERIPRLFGIQSTKSPAIYNAWRSGAAIPAPVRATTRADSISVDAPHDAVKALAAVRYSGGAFLAVEDEEILEAMATLARLGAVFAEPAGAAALAGLRVARDAGMVGAAETVVIVNTGNGLKDVAAVMDATPKAPTIEPTLEAVRRRLEQDLHPSPDRT